MMIIRMMNLPYRKRHSLPQCWHCPPGQAAEDTTLPATGHWGWYNVVLNRNARAWFELFGGLALVVPFIKTIIHFYVSSSFMSYIILMLSFLFGISWVPVPPLFSLSRQYFQYYHGKPRRQIPCAFSGKRPEIKAIRELFKSTSSCISINFFCALKTVISFNCESLFQ